MVVPVLDPGERVNSPGPPLMTSWSTFLPAGTAGVVVPVPTSGGDAPTKRQRLGLAELPTDAVNAGSGEPGGAAFDDGLEELS